MKRQHPRSKESHEISRCLWTRSEDKALKIAVQTYDGENWTAIAEYVQKYSSSKKFRKTVKQCRERWSNKAHHASHLTPLSQAEIRKLFSLHKKMGNRWSSIASQLPGRTDNIVKNWYLCKLRKLVRCIKKNTITSELPKNAEELTQKLYMLDYLYKYYLSSERYENIKKALNSQIKKRKNAGDKYINGIIERKEITIEKLSKFVRILLNEVCFNVDKADIHEYDYLKDIGSGTVHTESNLNNTVPNNDVKNETIISTSCIILNTF